jgi:hypothetical protein
MFLFLHSSLTRPCTWRQTRLVGSSSSSPLRSWRNHERWWGELRGCISWGASGWVISAYVYVFIWLIILVGDLNVLVQILSLFPQALEIAFAATTKQHCTEQSQHASSTARIAAPGTHRPRFGFGEEIWQGDYELFWK